MASDMWGALASEAGIASSQLALGVTHLSKTRPEYSWSYSRAFFSLSIGMERTAKLALHLNSKYSMGSFLPEVQMRNFGHRIDRLLNAVDEVASDLGIDIEQSRPNERIHSAIVDILSRFASTGRYYHLDYIGNQGSTTAIDPEREWWNNVVIPVANRHYQTRAKLRHSREAEFLEAEIGQISLVHFSHVDGSRIRTVQSSYEIDRLNTSVVNWVRMYVLQIARWLGAIICDPRLSTHDTPYMPDFFSWTQVDDKTFRSKNNWLNVLPG